MYRINDSITLFSDLEGVDMTKFTEINLDLDGSREECPILFDNPCAGHSEKPWFVLDGNRTTEFCRKLKALAKFVGVRDEGEFRFEGMDGTAIDVRLHVDEPHRFIHFYSLKPEPVCEFVMYAHEANDFADAVDAVNITY